MAPRSLVVLERETYDAEHRVEQLKAVHESFRQHLAYIDMGNRQLGAADVDRQRSIHCRGGY